ncbi:MAG: hypothetical protein ACJ8I9_08810 [Chthoniobacterales bacterium]
MIYALIALFWFGVAMSLLTAFLLLFPATPLDVLWRIKPEAKGDLVVFGYAAVLLMLIVAIACAFAAVGVTSRAEWGRLTAIAILSANLFGDCSQCDPSQRFAHAHRSADRRRADLVSGERSRSTLL